MTDPNPLECLKPPLSTLFAGSHHRHSQPGQTGEAKSVSLFMPSFSRLIFLSSVRSPSSSCCFISKTTASILSKISKIRLLLMRFRCYALQIFQSASVEREHWGSLSVMTSGSPGDTKQQTALLSAIQHLFSLYSSFTNKSTHSPGAFSIKSNRART